MSKKYQIIYADPPWQFSNKKTGGSMNSGAASIYPVMNIKNLMQMDVAGIANDNSIIVMWYVDSMAEEAIALAKAWGFKVKKMNLFVWDKVTSNGNPFFGMGFWTRAGAECALLGIRGKIRPACHSVRQVRTAPVGKHSAKPIEFRDDIVRLMGDLPRIEMFARSVADGWDLFGNEAPNSITIPMKVQS